MTEISLTLPKAILAEETRLHGARLWLARALWVGVALLVAAVLWEMVPRNYVMTSNEWVMEESHRGVVEWIGYSAWVRLYVVLEMAAVVVALASALIIFWRRSDDWVAIVISGTMLLLSVLFISSNLDVVRVAGVPRQVEVVIRSLVASLIIFSFVLLFYIFPDGRFVPGWTRFVFWLFFAIAVIANLLQQSGIAPANLDLGWAAAMLALVVVMPLGAASQIYRYRKVSTPLQRQQTKWVVAAFALVALAWLFAVVESFLPLAGGLEVVGSFFQIIQIPVQMVLPLALTFAVLRYRLWDVDVVLNRTLVYGALTVAILLIYGVVVGGIGSLLGGQGVGWLLPVAATALAALLFHPLRMALQGRVDRMLYGQRGDPLGVLRALGAQLEATVPAEEQLQNLAATVAQTLKLPWVGVELEFSGSEGAQSTLVAQSGNVTGGAGLERFALAFQGERLGALVVAPRAAGEALSGTDRRVLEGIALQAGPAIQAAQLTVRLQQSRQAIVAAREEERRRLRRDLHDGLGPQLASQTLTIDAIMRLQESNPERAQALLLDLKRQSQDAVRDIRRIVYDLRPPALDDMGLVEALRETAARAEQAGIAVVFDAPNQLSALSAVVESAAYHIAREGLANALRHAAATAIELCVAIEGDALVVVVEDNGSGVPADARSGVGFASMRERAAEVGGALVVAQRASGGTRVEARLPYLTPALS